MIKYRGERNAQENVIVRFEIIDIERDIRVTALYPPATISRLGGFEWGTSSERAAALASAILADLYDAETARTHAAAFLRDVIAVQPDLFAIDSRQIDLWLQQQRHPAGSLR